MQTTPTRTETESAELVALQVANEGLLAELRQAKERHAQALGELSAQFDAELAEVAEAKEKETAFAYQAEVSKLAELVQKLSDEKRALEEELSAFAESKRALAKYELQMNEILSMLNDEKAVRSHLRALATKLIEEVETLKLRTAPDTVLSNALPLLKTSVTVATNGGVNEQQQQGWKNRVSEKRDRINVQNMQIALEKEFQAKERVIEENATLRAECEAKHHRLSDLQAQIDELKRELANRAEELRKHMQSNLRMDDSVVLNSSNFFTFTFLSIPGSFRKNKSKN